MSKALAVGSVAVVVAALVLVSGFFLTQAGGMGATSSSSGTDASVTTSFQAGNQTYVATYVSTQSKTTSVTTATATSTESSLGDSFTYSPSSQIKVLFVNATVMKSGGGVDAVGFSLQVLNVGNRTVYVKEGGVGSSLNSSVPSDSTILREQVEPMCEIAMAPAPLTPGSMATLTTPGCWSGFSFELIGSGTVVVHFVFTWDQSAAWGSGWG